MSIDRLIEQILVKANPCIAGIDPDWNKIPRCYKDSSAPYDTLTRWAFDIIDCLADIIPAIKPQIAFFECFGSEGFRAVESINACAHSRGLLVIDDSKRGDIGNTARAYAHAHLSPDGPLNADFMTLSPFLGPDSLQPFIDAARNWGKGLFILAKTSNPGSADISESVHSSGQKVSHWLSRYIHSAGAHLIGRYGYSSVGAVVGATFPEEAAQLRTLMPHSFFLVPGYGAQGGSAADAVSCLKPDGLGAVISASRSILYPHLEIAEFDNTRTTYLDLVRTQAIQMQNDVYCTLKKSCPDALY